MAAEWICDGCGRRASGIATEHGGWVKPHDWYERHLSVKPDGSETDMFERGVFKTILTACSRNCIDRIAQATSTHGVVLPV